MAYALISKSFGPQNGGVDVYVTNSATSAPVTLYADTSGTVLSTSGHTYLTPAGNLHVYVTAGVNLSISLVSGSATNPTLKYNATTGKVSAAGVTLVPAGNVPISMNTVSGQLQSPDGTSVLPAAPAAVSVYDEAVLLTTSLSNMKFTGDGIAATYVGGQLTVTVPGAAGVTLGTMPDITTANLPTLNSPLSTALAGKFSILSDHATNAAAGAVLGLNYRRTSVAAGTPFVKAAVSTLGPEIAMYPSPGQTMTLELSTNNGGSYTQTFSTTVPGVYMLSPADNYVRISGTGTFDWV